MSNDIKNEKYVLALDLDNTVAMYTDGLRRHMVANHGYRMEDLPEPVNYNMAKCGWPFEDYGNFLDMHLEAVKAGMFRGLRPHPGAIEAAKIFQEEGIHISVVTHRLIQNNTYGMVATDTIQWLDNVGLRFNSISFSDRKSEIRAHAYVEDSPANILAIREAGMKVFTFDQEYNRHIEGERIYSWLDDGVEQILQHKKSLGL